MVLVGSVLTELVRGLLHVGFPWESWSIRSPHTRKILGSNPSGDMCIAVTRFGKCTLKFHNYSRME
jgi:hypothetical protein